MRTIIMRSTAKLDKFAPLRLTPEEKVLLDDLQAHTKRHHVVNGELVMAIEPACDIIRKALRMYHAAQLG